VYTSTAQSGDALLDKYAHYRARLFDDFVVVSPDVEDFGVNIPATDRVLDTLGKPVYISWGDGNCNFNHYLGFLATEYRLLKNNGRDYQETYEMLIYALLAIERLDLYSEYTLRLHENKSKLVDGDTIREYIEYPSDINGFLIRDDVSLGFWYRYSTHFNIGFGKINKTKDGTNTYQSIFKMGVVPKEEMSQDNIIRMLHALAMVKMLVDDEPQYMVSVNFINTLIPEYLASKQILADDSIYISRWVEDLANRLIGQMQHPYPEKSLCLKPCCGMAKVSSNHFLSLISTPWYITNPVTNELVAEGSGEDMGLWINSYGVAEAGNAITSTQNHHLGKSAYGVNPYLFKALLFKQMRLLPGGSFPLPKSIDDYMLRDLAVIADINWNRKSKNLFYALRDKRKRLTYEHQLLILNILHPEKYKSLYSPGTRYFEEDKLYYRSLLEAAPAAGPTSVQSNPEYSELWNSSSRMIWPGKGAPDPTNRWDFAGLDYLYLHNLYRLVFCPDNYSLPENRMKPQDKKTYLNRNSAAPGYDAEFFFSAPKAVRHKKE